MRNSRIERAKKIVNDYGIGDIQKVNPIIAVDFDGTLDIPDWCHNPLCEALKKLKKNGAKLILWTCRTGTRLEQAINWCKGEGLEFDAVNDNLPEVVQKYGNNSRKIYADYYIDDKNVLNPWKNDHLEVTEPLPDGYRLKMFFGSQPVLVKVNDMYSVKISTEMPNKIKGIVNYQFMLPPIFQRAEDAIEVWNHLDILFDGVNGERAEEVKAIKKALRLVRSGEYEEREEREESRAGE